jgi:hypothetical protein
MTVALFHSVCALLEAMWPAQYMGFMDALFHGSDFTVLQTSSAHPWRDYLYAMAVMALWALLLALFLHRCIMVWNGCVGTAAYVMHELH